MSATGALLRADLLWNVHITNQNAKCVMVCFVTIDRDIFGLNYASLKLFDAFCVAFTLMVAFDAEFFTSITEIWLFI